MENNLAPLCRRKIKKRPPTTQKINTSLLPPKYDLLSFIQISEIPSKCQQQTLHLFCVSGEIISYIHHTNKPAFVTIGNGTYSLVLKFLPNLFNPDVPSLYCRALKEDVCVPHNKIIVVNPAVCSCVISKENPHQIILELFDFSNPLISLTQIWIYHDSLKYIFFPGGSGNCYSSMSPIDRSFCSNINYLSGKGEINEISDSIVHKWRVQGYFYDFVGYVLFPVKQINGKKYVSFFIGYNETVINRYMSDKHEYLQGLDQMIGIGDLYYLEYKEEIRVNENTWVKVINGEFLFNSTSEIGIDLPNGYMETLVVNDPQVSRKKVEIIKNALSVNPQFGSELITRMSNEPELIYGIKSQCSDSDGEDIIKKTLDKILLQPKDDLLITIDENELNKSILNKKDVDNESFIPSLNTSHVNDTEQDHCLVNKQNFNQLTDNIVGLPSKNENALMETNKASIDLERDEEENKDDNCHSSQIHQSDIDSIINELDQQISNEDRTKENKEENVLFKFDQNTQTTQSRNTETSTTISPLLIQELLDIKEYNSQDNVLKEQEVVKDKTKKKKSSEIKMKLLFPPKLDNDEWKEKPIETKRKWLYDKMNNNNDFISSQEVFCSSTPVVPINNNSIKIESQNLSQIKEIKKQQDESEKEIKLEELLLPTQSEEVFNENEQRKRKKETSELSPKRSLEEMTQNEDLINQLNYINPKECCWKSVQFSKYKLECEKENDLFIQQGHFSLYLQELNSKSTTIYQLSHQLNVCCLISIIINCTVFIN
ncbi:hypothetical protein EDI_298040 [Entamoeba dispar SAW760]|uniref:Uncharacterized protein n=1 Tax=Entamoeba dispar (strain ATCC PRA-260 / SAW760) TaxID=370354 RepID=B0E6J6_ENTDS|nr:uncharacterized protein EDI_298040 [Entamoeba dispar SAW760]EDR29829.1 hypothetical protein EDI_298040 [Entamoeba dispar SAW760]|eukprot:EDR29829.1 hypothetical protein EDI_298040 [Entamoeba dispar SAW760]